MFVAAALLVFTAGGAHAQQRMACGPTKAVEKHLKGNFNEQVIAQGLGSNGMIMQLYSSPDGETWTLAMTRTDGMSCLMASGEFWQSVTPPVSQLGDPS